MKNTTYLPIPYSEDHVIENHETRQPFKLHDYQREAVVAVFKSWEQFDRSLLIAPTGSGKTVIFAEITEQRQPFGRTLILAHRDELIDQPIDKLHRFKGLHAAKEKAQARADLDAGIVVASVQTLARSKRLERFPGDHFDTLIVDEAHHALAETYQRILRHFHNDKTLGVTATPDRGDTRNLGRFFEDIALEIGLVDLIKAGFLCPIKVRTVPVKIDISNVSTRAGDFSEEELAEALEPVLEKIAEAVVTFAENRKTLIFVPLIRIADQFADTLRRHELEVRDLLDIIDLCIAYQAPELENYEPTMHWHVRELTPKQIQILSHHRVDLSCVQNRGHASAIIDTIFRHHQSLPATPKQLGFLYYLGYRGDTSTLSKPAASRLIADLKNKLEAASAW